MIERVWGKGNPPILLVGMYIGAATVEDSMEVPQKTNKNHHMIQQSHSRVYIGQTNFKRYMHPCVHSITIHNSQDMETT